MPRYVWKALPATDVEQPFHTRGEVVAVSKYGERPATRSTAVLLRLPEGGEADPEGIDELTCSGKDGDCSRAVESPGDYCWQHDDE